ncbi:MAG: flagellar biosynthesis protein FlhA [Psychromonas sp.]|nr:flagellar biosynthesis protein FlhA [Psychromonas sp.]
MRINSLIDKTWINRRTILQGIGTPLLVLATLGMIILPMPTLLLDMLFTFNIAIALVILLVSIYTKRPLDFSAFPTVLLVATLLRLALNVASTRIVLLEGHKGGDAAGNVIEAFGSVVIGGNLAVGLIVFIILMIINFVVVTKGAGRISEVSARFTLDAMPGKQMAIDADLNAGLIDEVEAKDRRAEVTSEADFYGSMDGASKFVKGDAVAGLMILLINIIGGFIIGMVQFDLTLVAAAEIYTLLTIGDGLVAQIPSLLLSISAAIIVTRENTEADMGTRMLSQILDDPKVLIIASGLLLVMGIVPGMPHFAFLTLGGALAWFSYWKTNKSKTEESVKITEQKAITDEEKAESQRVLDWDDVHSVDTIGLEVGYRLIPLVDKGQNGELLDRIKGVRKKLSQELGFLIPAVHIRDNLDLVSNNYTLSLMGVICGQAEIYHDKSLAINPGQVFGPIEGVVGVDPAFGLESTWIDETQCEQAQTLGYTVVDAATVVATHLSQILSNNAAQLLGHEEVQSLLDILAEDHPKLVEGLVPDILTLSTVVKVLQGLLIENVSLRDIRTIVQTLVDYGPRSQDPEVLVAACRISLKRMIVQEIVAGEPELPVITLSTELEQVLHKSLQAGGSDGAGIEPGLAERIQTSLVNASQKQELLGQPAILLTSGILRGTLSKFVKHTIPSLHVLSYQEIPDDKQIKIISSVGQ